MDSCWTGWPAAHRMSFPAPLKLLHPAGPSSNNAWNNEEGWKHAVARENRMASKYSLTPLPAVLEAFSQLRMMDSACLLAPLLRQGDQQLAWHVCRFVEEMDLSPDGKGAQRDSASSKASAVTSSSRDSLYKCVGVEFCMRAPLHD
jgi:hypothetical protein